MFPDSSEDKDGSRTTPNIIEGNILKLGVVIGRIESNCEYSKGIQENDT